MFLNQKKKRRYAPFFFGSKTFCFRKNRKNRFFEPRGVDFLVCSGEVYLYINVNTAPSARFDAYSSYSIKFETKKVIFALYRLEKLENRDFFHQKSAKIRQSPPNPELQSQIFRFRGLQSKNYMRAEESIPEVSAENSGM